MAYSSLTELVRRKGGVVDYGGELRDMLGGKTVRKVRRKTGRVHYARSGRGIIRKRGMDIDDMRHAAIEEGFLHEGAGVNDFLDALADESRGRLHRSRFDDIQLPAREWGEAPRRRKPERPTIPPHPALSKRCTKCGVMHGKNSHRFHGRGSWLRTHLFPYKSNPGVSMTVTQAKQYVDYYTGLIRHGMQLVKEEQQLLMKARQVMRMVRRKNPRGTFLERLDRERRKLKRRGGLRKAIAAERRAKKRLGVKGLGKRPPARRVKNPRRPVIYHRLLRIEARKGPGHRCDAGCKKANHSYFHDFTAGAVVYGNPDGSVLVKNRAGKRLWKYF